MKANDTLMMKFLEGSKQFVVPLFQRTYSWGNPQLETLWNDVESTRNGEESVHFFGSFVSEPLPSSASGVSRFVVIDGQQRLVTTFVFLAALRNRIKEMDPSSQLKEEIHDLYLTNRYHPEDKYKLVPTQADRQIYFDLVDDKQSIVSNFHLLLYAKKFFADKLSKIDDISELTVLKNIILSHFSAVDVRLEASDDPYLVFESLNAKGTPLTQADLIRNYLFMRVGLDNQEQVYKDLWFPMQQNLSDNLEGYVRHYLAMDGSIPSFERIYGIFREKANKTAKNEKQVLELIEDLVRFASYYELLLHPEKEKQEQLKAGLTKLNRLEVSTSYPLLLRLYDDYNEGKLSEEDFGKVLKLIETYIIRRAVCGVPTNVLNRYFPTVYQNLDKNKIPESLSLRLQSQTGQQRLPDTGEFESALLSNSMYGDKIVKFILEEIERHDNKEVVDFTNLQIEHIMPQTLSDEWENDLRSQLTEEDIRQGKTPNQIHQKYVDTMGNLTLTGYNPEYFNKRFVEKRDMPKGYKDSNLKINSNIAKLNKWGEQEIQDRAKYLSTLASKIWET